MDSLEVQKGRSKAKNLRLMQLYSVDSRSTSSVIIISKNQIRKIYVRKVNDDVKTRTENISETVWICSSFRHHFDMKPVWENMQLCSLGRRQFLYLLFQSVSYYSRSSLHLPSRFSTSRAFPLLCDAKWGRLKRALLTTCLKDYRTLTSSRI